MIQNAAQQNRMGQLSSPGVVMDPYAGSVPQPPVDMPPEITVGQPPAPPFTPETTAMDRFNELIDAYPGYQDKNMMQKIIAGLASLANPQGAMEALQYQPGLEQWESMLGPMQAAAQEERYSNVAGQRTRRYRLPRGDQKSKRRHPYQWRQSTRRHGPR